MKQSLPNKGFVVWFFELKHLWKKKKNAFRLHLLDFFYFERFDMKLDWTLNVVTGHSSDVNTRVLYSVCPAQENKVCLWCLLSMSWYIYFKAFNISHSFPFCFFPPYSFLHTTNTHKHMNTHTHL